jgi:outer membrane protein
MIAIPLVALAVLAQAGTVLTLDDALARAAAHPRIAEVRSVAGQASARGDEARAGYLPSATAFATYLPAQVGESSGKSATNIVSGTSTRLADAVNPFYQASIVVTQPLWDFGRTRGVVRSATLAEEATGSDLAAAAKDVELQVRAAYYNALAADELVRVAADAERQMQAHLALAKASLEVGRRTPFDVARAEVDVASARITRIQAESGLAAARSALGAAIGEEIGTAALTRPAERPLEDLAPERAVSAALAQRPEIAAFDVRMNAQRAAVSAASSAFYPVVSAVGQLAWKGTELPAARTWQLGFTVSVPFLAGGADVARVREAEAAFGQLRSQRDALVLQIKAEAEQAALAVGEARARQSAAEALLAQAKDSLALAEGRYEAGVGSIIELSDAQAALTNARAQHVRAGYDLATARARLERAVGAPSVVGAAK